MSECVCFYSSHFQHTLRTHVTCKVCTTFENTITGENSNIEIREDKHNSDCVLYLSLSDSDYSIKMIEYDLGHLQIKRFSVNICILFMVGSAGNKLLAF